MASKPEYDLLVSKEPNGDNSIEQSPEANASFTIDNMELEVEESEDTYATEEESTNASLTVNEKTDSLKESSDTEYKLTGKGNKKLSKPMVLFITLVWIMVTSLFIIFFVKVYDLMSDDLSATTTAHHDIDNDGFGYSASQNYVQIFNGTRIDLMDDIQVKSFERFLTGYIKLYAAFGLHGTLGRAGSDMVLSHCKIQSQTLHSQNNTIERDFDDRGLEKQHRDMDVKYLEVGYTMMFLSSTTDVAEENYTSKFFKFMNSVQGKLILRHDMNDVGLAVEGIEDLRVAAVLSRRATNSPTLSPTVKPVKSNSESTAQNKKTCMMMFGYLFCL